MGRISKTDQDDAYTAGRTARDDGLALADCPHDGITLSEKWKLGWNEADNTIEEERPIDGFVPGDGDEPGEFTPIPQHNFEDASVIEFGTNIAELMQAFDNLGVSIVEEQFRALSEEQIRLSTKWASDARIGTKRPVPEFLRQYATEQLIAFSDGYLEAQNEFRKVLMKCRYGKPSPTKPEGDDGEPKIKMTVLVPLDEVSPGTAEAIWGGMECQVEFGLKSVSEWQKELPGTEQTISCFTEVKGYSRKMRDWQFSFLVSQELLSIEEAFENYWKSNGSCRVTPQGEIQKEARDEHDSAPSPERQKASDPLPGQMSLFDPLPIGENTNQLMNEKKEFRSPDEYLIPMLISGAEHVGNISIGHGANDQWYASSFVAFLDGDEKVDQDLDYGLPQYDGDGCVTAKAAVEKELGSLISVFLRDYDAPKVVDDLRNELKRLNDGGEPYPMPEGEE